MNAPSTPLSLSPGECAIAYRERRHEQLAQVFIDLLDKFRATMYFDIDARTAHFVNVFTKNFLFYFTQEDFAVSEPLLLRFIESNAVICNVVGMSHFRTTDAYVRLLLEQGHNFAKVLALYNPRCTVELDRAQVFAANPAIATVWYYSYFENYRAGCVSQTCWVQMRKHLYHIDDRMQTVTMQMHHAYFGATYVDFEREHALKRRVNESIKQWSANQPAIRNKPNPRKACVVTAMWFAGHSVYRCMRKFLETLSEDFELTLISLSNPENIETDLFDGGVRHFSLAAPHNREAFADNDFALAFFPDIGMNMDSIYLSNQRIAPVQVCGYGHPVTTQSAEIDYWLGGLDTEDADAAEENYSERLVLIPGAGVMPNKPRYERRWNHQASQVVRINCSWSAQKINFFNLSMLRRIADEARSQVHFRFFPSASAMSGAYIPLRREIAEVLGDERRFQVFGSLHYDSYMAVMEDAELTLDPYPFGGYATATDALFIGKPIVTLEGRKFYNRSTASLLRKLHLGELIANNPDDYVRTAVRLVDDADYRGSIVKQIEEADLDTTIFADDSSQQFHRAMAYLVKHHDRLQAEASRTPLIFK